MLSNAALSNFKAKPQLIFNQLRFFHLSLSRWYSNKKKQLIYELLFGCAVGRK
jgi:hypothetical protein